MIESDDFTFKRIFEPVSYCDSFSYQVTKKFVGRIIITGMIDYCIALPGDYVDIVVTGIDQFFDAHNFRMNIDHRDSIIGLFKDRTKNKFTLTRAAVVNCELMPGKIITIRYKCKYEDDREWITRSNEPEISILA